MSQAGNYDTSSIFTPIVTLTGDAGGPVGPTVGNVDLLGGNNITTTGVPATSTVTIDLTGTTDHTLQVGNATGSLTSLAAATDGQIPIGSTGLDPVVSTLTAGIGATITNGAGSITVGAPGVDQSDILYVGKHGNDANDGLTINKAFLTFTAALAAASSGDVIWCFDNGLYTENLSVATSNINIYATNAIISGAHTIGPFNIWEFGEIRVAAGTTGITLNSAASGAGLLANRVVISGNGIGVLATAGSLFVDFGRSFVDSGFLIGQATSDTANVRVGDITFTGAGTAFGTSGSGIANIHLGTAVNDGVAGNGTLFFTTGVGTPLITARVALVDLSTLSNITATSDVRLTVAAIRGTALEIGAGIVTVGGSERIDNVPIGAVTPSTGAFTTLTATTPIDVPSGGTGVATITDHALVVGSGVAAITPLAAATDGQIPIGSTGADPVIANITSSLADLAITNGAGSIDINFDANTALTGIHGWNGAILETAAITVTAAAGTITFSIEQSGTGDLTVVFSDGFYNWVTAPDTVVLTAGTDTVPQINYVYFLQSTKTLTASTVSFPATEHAPLATVLCQSAASLQTNGAYKVHAWTDHVTGTNDQGHIEHLNFWIREQNATWSSGVVPNLTITPNGGAADNVIFTSGSGVVLQLHDHVFPAFAGTPDVYTVNDSVTPYNIVTDLNALLTDSTGGSMSGRFFSLVIWGVVSESAADCKLMVNLPGGTYGTSAQLTADDSRFTDFSIPPEFKGTGFLIAQYNLRHQVAASGTWTLISSVDLRGFVPSISAGAGTAAGSTFDDSVFRIFDDGDNTKQIAFEASAITTATTRTITMDDRNIDMDAVPDSFATDGAAATPAAGILTVAGGTGIDTSGAGSTVTVAFAASAAADFAFTTAVAGTTRTLTVSNTDATAANYSSAELELISQSASTGDPFIRFNVNGGQDYALGVDNSDADSLKIQDDADPSTGNTLWEMTAAGERTMPLQPAFLATLETTDSNVTGNGTVFALGSGNAMTEIFDQGGDFNTNGTFTAPVTGRYAFYATAFVIGNTIATQYNLTIVTSNRTYQIIKTRAASALNFPNELVCFADMDAADTATVGIQIQGEAADTSDVQGAPSNTWFSGHLVC